MSGFGKSVFELTAVVVICTLTLFAVVVAFATFAQHRIEERDRRASLTPIWLEEEAEPPEIYTGQVVDIDGDDQADVALFGDPSSPEVEQLRSPPWWGPTAMPALISSVGAVVVAVIARVKTGA